MNPIRERILGDRGFTEKKKLLSPTEKDELITKLTIKIERLERKLEDKDKVFEEQRSTEHIKLNDKVAELKKENRQLMQTSDKIKTENESLKKQMKSMGEIEKLIEDFNKTVK